MSDGVTTDRLVMLRNRWEADPTSRIFLQLAEEHRHLGQVQEALGVLDRGLQEHPGYLSALVAKGRCHLELGEPEVAKPVLERVVKQDATQMVANKLLVRAYLETGEADRARERLDLYRLLNDSDPEIEVLRRKIQAMDRPVAGVAPEPKPAPAAAVTSPLPVFTDLPRSAEPVMPLHGSEILGPAPPLVAPETPPVHRSESNPFTQPSEPPRVRVSSSFDEVFPGLHPHQNRDHYLDALSAEGIFPLPAADVALPVEAGRADGMPVPAAVREDLPIPRPVAERQRQPWSLAAEPFDLGVSPLPQLSFEPEPVFPAASPPSAHAAETEHLPSPFLSSEPAAAEPYLEPEPIFDLPAEPVPDIDLAPKAKPVVDLAPEPELAPLPEPFREPPATAPAHPISLASAPDEDEPTVSELHPIAAAEPAPAAPLATVTLADLYVHQGYPAEAERIYREVLEREPGSAAARSGLERLARMERRLRTLAARDLLVDYQPGGSGGNAETSRTRHMLHSYLKRLRERSPRDVS